MSDYFGYDVHFVMNITDIDDKVRLSLVGNVHVTDKETDHYASEAKPFNWKVSYGDDGPGLGTYITGVQSLESIRSKGSCNRATTRWTDLHRRSSWHEIQAHIGTNTKQRMEAGVLEKRGKVWHVLYLCSEYHTNLSLIQNLTRN